MPHLPESAETAQPSHAPNSGGYHHGNLRQALLNAAEELLRTEGLPALTLRACARSAGVSHAAPTHHFGNLEGLLTALAVHGLEQLAAYQEREIEQAGTILEEKKIAAGLGYIEFALDQPALFDLMFTEPRINRQDVTFRSAADKASAHINNLLREETAVQEKRHTEGKDEEHQKLLWTRSWSMVHGFAVLAKSGLISYPMPARMSPPMGRDSLRQLAQAMLKS